MTYSLLSIRLLLLAASTAHAANDRISLRLSSWTAHIDPQTLAISGARDRSRDEFLVVSPHAGFGRVENLHATQAGASWSYPEDHLGISVKADANRLRVAFQSAVEQQLEWPVTGDDPKNQGLVLPDNEGLYIPVDDVFWRSVFEKEPCRDAHERLSMPFWGFKSEEGTITYILADELHSELCTLERGGRLLARIGTHFSSRDGLPGFEVLVSLTGPSPIAPALEYRRWLQETGRFKTLREKIAEVPEAEKLLGAAHAYVWTDGRSLDSLRALQQLGLDRLLIAYDQEPGYEQPPLVDAKFIALAKSYGFLVSAYEIFTKLDRPGQENSITSTWPPGLYDSACLRGKDGALLKKWKGCELSSESLRRLEPGSHHLEHRIDGHVKLGVNSLFYDEDAYGIFFEDYSKDHPMTKARDRENRLERMMMGVKRRLVVGSETATGWFAPAIHFSHGTMTIHNDLWWPLANNAKVYGGFSPRREQSMFFKKVQAPDDLVKGNFNPAYRLPLYEAVFHDAIVTTDRYDLSMVKLKNLVQVRELLQLLYGVPPNWNLDRKEIKMYSDRISRNYRVFSPIHRTAGDRPLTSFEWLSADRLVQRTRFGDEIELTSNFGKSGYATLPPLCLEIRRLRDSGKQIYCPRACVAGEDCFPADDKTSSPDSRP